MTEILGSPRGASRNGRYGLVVRFALMLLGAFLLVGVLVHVLVARNIRGQHERFLEFHAVFVTDSVLAELMDPGDVSRPVDAARYQELLRLAEERVLVGGVFRINVWRSDGVVLFSDQRDLVGERFPRAIPDLTRALEGGPESRYIDAAGGGLPTLGMVTDAYQTYVPLEIPRGPTTVAEIYQDYSPAAVGASQALRTFDTIFISGLLLLYALVLPLARQISGRLRQQASRLEELLSQEKETVRRLQELDRMKGEFLTATSHELRTPLTSIIGYTRTLESQQGRLDDGQIRDMLARIGANAQRLERLIGDLLDLDRMSRGIVHPNLIETDIPALARRVVDQSGVALTHRVTVKTEPAIAEVDPAMVERIIENLLANVARHTPDGTSATLHVSLSDQEILIAVDDEGPGVPGELKTKVFEPFAQGPWERPESPGTGIGLAMVARLAELHGGRAWVEDTDSGGASFKVSLTAEEIHSSDQRFSIAR